VTRSLIQAHSNNGRSRNHVTKVLHKAQSWVCGVLICFAVWPFVMANAAAEIAGVKPAEALYLQLGQIGLDPARVYKVRDASLTRSAIQISLNDGTIAFTQDVMGRVTGAFFEGDGEVLLTPPNEVERRSMSLFTGMAILEEHFSTAYFRFNDDSANELRPDLRAPENAQEFIAHWDTTASNLAQADAIRLLLDFSQMLPVKGIASAREALNSVQNAGDRFLHARLQGVKLGIFDVYFDSISAEQVQVGQAKTAENGVTYYDVWASFSTAVQPSGDTEKAREDSVLIRDFKIATEVEPPTDIHSAARLQVEVREDGARTLLFELSRFLQIESVKLDGQPVEFIHNPAVEGTQLARRGNDVVAVILPEPAHAGQKLSLEFVYGGEVLAEAGRGLLYVGARGTWYPNRGLAMANFDLTFNYPQGWTLVATGKPVVDSDAADVARDIGEKTGRWVSERPIPVAGFNLGKYKMATAQAGDVVVETYATPGVEKDFPNQGTQVIEQDLPSRRPPPLLPPPVIVSARPSPARNEVTVAESAARAIQYYADRFGPYPYSHLALTQLPGRDSQGWPGLVFLSSYAFLDERERAQLHFDPVQILMQQMIPAHETAHQWWGDLIGWSTYRDQWFSEGLASYCALMMLQEKNPSGFRQIMNKYRTDLLAENKDGVSPQDAGPVTLGGRLLSSRLPEGYEAISYGRGTWLFHMLRMMLKDGAAQEKMPPGKNLTGSDEPFVRALLKVRQRYQGKFISTRELLNVFAEDLPPSLRYQGKESLDWFLDGWVNGTSLPKLELKAVKFTPKGAGTVVTGTILQKDASENLVTSIPVYAALAGKQAPVFLGRVFADGEETSFHLTAPAGARKIVLDPNETILTDPR
jgi:hypothetical protein